MNITKKQSGMGAPLALTLVLVLIIALLSLCTPENEDYRPRDLNRGARMNCEGARLTWKSLFNEDGHNERVRRRCYEMYPPKYPPKYAPTDFSLTEEEKATNAAKVAAAVKQNTELSNRIDRWMSGAGQFQPNATDVSIDQQETNGVDPANQASESIRIYSDGQFHWDKLDERYESDKSE